MHFFYAVNIAQAQQRLETREHLLMDWQGIFFAHVERMQKIGELIVGDLEENEKLQLVSFLNRLNDFHQPIYHENKKEDIEQLLSFRKQ